MLYDGEYKGSHCTLASKTIIALYVYTYRDLYFEKLIFPKKEGFYFSHSPHTFYSFLMVLSEELR